MDQGGQLIMTTTKLVHLAYNPRQYALGYTGATRGTK